MADTTTTNYSLTKPEVGASEDTWGTKLNSNLDTIDSQLKANADAAAAAQASANTALGKDPTLTLSGDVTGSATFTNLGNATLTAVVVNDSHTHDGRYYTESELGATSSQTAAGAYKIGVYQAELANSASTNVQDVLDDLDAAISGKQAAGSYLTTSTGFGGDVSGTYNAIVVANNSHTHNGSTIDDNSISAAELNVIGNGTTAQFLRSDGDGSFTWATPTDTNTTYSAGAGLDLSGTTFLIESDIREYTNAYFGGSGGEYFHYDGTNNLIRGYVNSAEVMRLYSGTTGVHFDGDVIAYSATISDERLKEDFASIDNALEKLNTLGGYTFKYKADGKISAGVIAQQVEAVLPEAVSEKELGLHTGDNGQTYKVVNYDALHGLLIEAVKELTKRVEELEAK